MCLHEVDSKTKHTEGGIGYKVFKKRGRVLSSLHFYHRDASRFKLNTEYVVQGDDDRPPDTSGFHLFPNKDDAKVFCWIHGGSGVWKVNFSDTVASGKDDCRNLPSVIARKMTILGKVARRSRVQL